MVGCWSGREPGEGRGPSAAGDGPQSRKSKRKFAKIKQQKMRPSHDRLAQVKRIDSAKIKPDLLLDHGKSIAN